MKTEVNISRVGAASVSIVALFTYMWDEESVSSIIFPDHDDLDTLLLSPQLTLYLRVSRRLVQISANTSADEVTPSGQHGGRTNGEHDRQSPSPSHRGRVHDDQW